MSKCFIIQPFDGDRFDELYEEVFQPAIRDTELIPYRVDKDLSVAIPIDQIESEIRNATLCLAEITTNNPNVWFELGYAISAGKPVVIVCAEERTDFPFDVQHRQIIRNAYLADSCFRIFRREAGFLEVAIPSKD